MPKHTKEAAPEVPDTSLTKTGNPVELGKSYYDALHGPKGVWGIAVMRTIHLTGCDRITLERVVLGTLTHTGVDANQLIEAETDLPVDEEAKPGASKESIAAPTGRNQ